MSAEITPQRYLGVGWGFPVRPDAADGRLRMEAGAEKVRRSILIILETEPGERVMNPAFGCPLRSYLMQPNSVGTRALMKRDVELALGRWEPRIELVAVDVTPGDDPSLAEISISYRHIRDGRPGNLVYPFYLASATGAA
jgi:phage baseplate assembly protein W